MVQPETASPEMGPEHQRLSIHEESPGRADQAEGPAGRTVGTGPVLGRLQKPPRPVVHGRPLHMCGWMDRAQPVWTAVSTQAGPQDCDSLTWKQLLSWVFHLVTKLCLTLCDPTDCSPPGSSVHGISQARILEWVPFPSPGDLPDPGIEPTYALAGGFFTTEPPRKPILFSTLLFLIIISLHGRQH